MNIKEKIILEINNTYRERTISVLDIGSAECYELATIADACSNIGSVLGIDNNRDNSINGVIELQEDANKYFELTYSHFERLKDVSIKFIETEAIEYLQKNESKYDVIIMLGLIHFILEDNNKVKLINLIFDTIVKDGMIFIQTIQKKNEEKFTIPINASDFEKLVTFFKPYQKEWDIKITSNSDYNWDIIIRPNNTSLNN